MEVKFCKLCQTEHPLTKDYWYKHKGREFSVCAIKARERKRKWCKNNKDKVREYKRREGYRYKQSFKGRYAYLKKECKRRKKDLEINVEQYIEIVKLNECHYCGSELPKQGSGIDRKDSSIGYLIDNVVSCCYACNKIKNDTLTYNEMIEVAKLLKELRK